MVLEATTLYPENVSDVSLRHFINTASPEMLPVTTGSCSGCGACVGEVGASGDVDISGEADAIGEAPGFGVDVTISGILALTTLLNSLATFP